MRDDEGKARRFAKQLRRELTDAEVLLWSQLRRWPLAKIRRQHTVGIYIADFACVAARLIVEVDGATHSSDAEIAHDLVRTKYLEQRGWRIFRVTNEDVYKNLDGVLSAIASLLPLHRFAVPLPRERGRKLVCFTSPPASHETPAAPRVHPRRGSADAACPWE